FGAFVNRMSGSSFFASVNPVVLHRLGHFFFFNAGLLLLAIDFGLHRAEVFPPESVRIFEPLIEKPWNVSAAQYAADYTAAEIAHGIELRVQRSGNDVSSTLVQHCVVGIVLSRHPRHASRHIRNRVGSTWRP